MPHPVFQIDELLRLIIDHLVNTCPSAAVSFAATCRSLEEPTLSSLWKRQYYFNTLLGVLPSFTYGVDEVRMHCSAVSGSSCLWIEPDINLL